MNDVLSIYASVATLAGIVFALVLFIMSILVPFFIFRIRNEVIEIRRMLERGEERRADLERRFREGPKIDP